MLKFNGLVKTSLVDYPGKVAAVVFLQGCNYHCAYCHNPSAISMTGGVTTDDQAFFGWLGSRRGKLDGVVICGGEPTLQMKDLVPFLEEVRLLGGYSIKLDTNGSNPSAIKELIKRKLVDYYALDIKTSFTRYDEVAFRGAGELVKETALLLKEQSPDYEYRTTMYPLLVGYNELVELSQELAGIKRWYLQQYRSAVTYSKDAALVKPYLPIELEQLLGVIRPCASEVGIRGT